MIDGVVDGNATVINILANDDYLNNSDANNLGNTTITATGNGSATGVIVFDAATGELSYTPDASEAGQTVTIEYEVCNDESGSLVCDTAVITISFEGGDSDGDGINDIIEGMDGTDPLDDCDSIGGTPLGTSDCDNDGLSNADEATLGTDPDIADTDGDGISDGQEFSDGTNPLDDCDSINGTPLDASDCDGDGLTTAEEAENGTLPDNPDTDGDQISDGQEILDGTDPLNPCDSLNGTPPDGSACSLNIMSEYVVPGSGTEDEAFRIENIERFPNNTVRIYNRWGVLVYEIEGYDNSGRVFRGISNGRATLDVDEELPVGVYFYIIEYDDNGTARNLKGYLYINR